MGSHDLQGLRKSSELHASGSNPILPSSMDVDGEHQHKSIAVAIDLDDLMPKSKSSSEEEDWEDVEEKPSSQSLHPAMVILSYILSSCSMRKGAWRGGSEWAWRWTGHAPARRG